MPPPVDRSSQNWQISLFPIRCLQDFCCSFAKVSSFCQLRGSSFAAAGIGVQIHPIQFPRICKTAFSHFHIQFKKSHSLFSFCTFAKQIFIFSEFKEESQLQLFCTVFTLVTTNDKIWKSKWMSPWKNERQDSQINGEDIFHWVLQISAFYFPTFEKADCSIFSLSVSGSVGWCHH